MQLNLHSDYALRILMTLAAANRQMSVDEISRRYAISRNHLSKVAQRLQAEGFVKTFRGRGGGMRLARPAEEISVGEVVRRFENLNGFVGCFPGGAGCVVDGLCALKPALGGALDAFLSHLDAYRLSDLIPDRAAFMERLDGAATLPA
ncbi:Rrf2 family nitric oxide-sensitive transcriptional repressor [Altererythrobacter atlanticus]|uniref:HTH-type transcriptional repressor NsrR n=1 Tax=Croceibacterium atlanticum TaxID=1267766 RepID=A0A0F7KQA7_9SPHN|nr:Rrf2 family transcriptional regulator [Croceibacterium atlanticum]AKH41332.1 HTH-type transcriptional repressor NsrR [Croceibacterium atlanticum]MBB5734154.1 Rrf2 family nitric oxide-sensitive transcriptional repressor [Croceibacterium atlanticum]